MLPALPFALERALALLLKLPLDKLWSGAPCSSARLAQAAAVDTPTVASR
jgi:hypothetical protein